MAIGRNNEVDISKIDLKALAEALDACKGPVYYVTDEGDKINMKSAFCRMVGLLRIIEGGQFSGGRFVCENEEDVATLFRFNLYGTLEK